MPSDDRAIAISATFTAEAIQPGLAFWAGELGLDLEIRFAGYNQLFQVLLDPGGLFARNRRGVNVALVRFEDWLRDGGAAGLEERARKLVLAVRNASSFSAAPLVLAICPATPVHGTAFECLERALADEVAELPAVYALTPREVEALYPAGEVHDPHGDELGHLPYTPEFFMALATAIARKIHAILQPPYKVVALDCDETLWAGICGEDGPLGVTLDAPRRDLQEFMAGLRRAGMLLALASKNNEDDVAETFRAHPEMPLRLEDFAARRIDWSPKSANLRGLAEELELAPESFILVDDDPKECTEAQAGAPEVLALPLPERAEEIPAFLRHVWAFDRARVTEEDRNRPMLYERRAMRARTEQAAGSLEEFIGSLQLEVRIAPMERHQVARVAQLTQRTSQMNATSIRRTEAGILELERSGATCLAVEVKDRFGSYGLTGVAIFQVAGASLAVDTFLASCRVLGRGVEHRMVARLGQIAREIGLSRVEIPFSATPRNRPAALFLNSLCAPDADGVFRLTAEEAAAATYRVGNPAPPASQPVLPAGAEAVRKRPDYVKIATTLRDPTAILERIRAATRRTLPRRAATPPRTPLEQELVELWAGLLNVPLVGIDDNFFELGGHSLLAVQLLSRVRHIYSVDLSLEVVYSGEFTVAELAKAVELKGIEQSGGDYQDLLEELDGLSEEEVQALLAKEREGG
jgi:FkbH-like protein